MIVLIIYWLTVIFDVHVNSMYLKICIFFFAYAFSACIHYCVYFVLLIIWVFIANKMFYLIWCYFLRQKKETLALVVLLHNQLKYQSTKLDI